MRIDIRYEDGAWDIVLREGEESPASHARLTTQEVLAKIGDLLVAWTAPKTE